MLTEQNGIQVDKFYPPTDWQYSFPDGYTRLEYLESTGTQYIDTGIVPNANTRILTKIEVITTTQNIAVFGCYNTSADTASNYKYYHLTASQNKWYYGKNGSESSTSNGTYSPVIGTQYNIDFNNNNSIIINNTTMVSDLDTNGNGNLYISYRRGNTLSSSPYGRFKYFYFIIFDNDTLVRNFIPAKRNSDNKPGMYDLVNNVFYTNAGTGEFVMGPELYSNNSQIDIRQKNNTNFVEKYKFNENNELIWANPQLNLSGPVGYTKVGNPTITDGVVSGFSSSDYLVLNQNYNVTNTMNTEIYFRAKTPSTISSGFNFIYSNTSGYPTYFFLGTYSSVLFTARMGRLQNGLELKFSDLYISIQTDTWYRFKITGNNGIWKFEIFDDNGNLLKTDTKDWTNNTINANYNFRLQCIDNTNNYSGSIDLKETYIKVNDKLWFYGKNYTSENYAPVPAGLNYNNTTTPSIGYVNTQTQEFTPAPTDGIKYSQTRDIKVIPPEDNTITLLYGVKSDFSKYALFGLLANTSSGTYDVYIDDVLYATTASATQTDIDFSALGSEYVPIGTCTTPEVLVLHKIVVKPNTSGATLITFKGAIPTGATGNQNQGVLWTHFELSNEIRLINLASQGGVNAYHWINLIAITAKNDNINLRETSANIGFLVHTCGKLKYVPLLIGSITYASQSFQNCKELKRLRIEDLSNLQGSLTYTFYQTEKLEQITTKKVVDKTKQYISVLNNTFNNMYLLKLLKSINYSTITSINAGIGSIKNLYPTKLDVSDAKGLTTLGTYGTSTYPMRGLRGLKVSNEAPFTGDSPQINVSYTGLDRDALVELFNSLPDVSEATDGITRAINITAATGNNITKVGTGVTIDENGVASGFDYDNFFSLAYSLVGLDKNFEIQTEIKINSLSNTTILGGKNAFKNAWSLSNGKIQFNYPITNGTGTKRLTVFVFNSVTLGKRYILNAKRTGNIINFKIYEDGVLKETGKYEIPKGYNYSSDLEGVCGIGTSNSSAGGYLDGEVYLENIFCKVDGNYNIKGYLTDNDRLIATNKGWTITG